MLRFIVYRYISYKDRKISHASLLTLRHHLSLLHPALHRPHSPTTYPCPTTCTCPTTHLIAPPALLHTALRPASTLLHPALLPTSLPYDLHLPYSTQPYYLPHCPTTCTRPTPPSSTTHLTTLLLHTTYPTTRLSIPDPPTLPMCTLLPIHSCALTCYTYYYYPAHTCHVPLSTPPSPSPPQMYHATPISYRLYHTALPRTPLSSI